MLRKLEIDALQADLSAVDAMLASFTEEDDPIGWYQFNLRKKEIAQALEDLQGLISKCYSGRESGRLDQHGPVPCSNTSQMLVTNIVRGSVGFVLDESGHDARLVETPLKEVVDQMTGTLFVLPESKRFDFITMDKGQKVILKGTLSASVLRQIDGDVNDEQQTVDPRTITCTPWVVEIKTRELREGNRESRYVHTLQRLVCPETDSDTPD